VGKLLVATTKISTINNPMSHLNEHNNLNQLQDLVTQLWK